MAFMDKVELIISSLTRLTMSQVWVWLFGLFWLLFLLLLWLFWLLFFLLLWGKNFDQI